MSQRVINRVVVEEVVIDVAGEWAYREFGSVWAGCTSTQRPSPVLLLVHSGIGPAV